MMAPLVHSIARRNELECLRLEKEMGLQRQYVGPCLTQVTQPTQPLDVTDVEHV
jgi:hypothetical protein